MLIIKPTALGDVAQTALVVPAIKKHLPHAHVSWLVDEDYAPLVELCEGVDAIVPFPRRRWRERVSWNQLWHWLKSLDAEEYDVALDLQGLARSAVMTWASGAKRKIGLHSAREGARWVYTELIHDTAEHAVERYRQAITSLTGVPEANSYLKKPERMESLPQTYGVMHPYSLWETKLWDWERYEQVARALPELTWVLVGKGERFPVTAPNVVELRGTTDLRQLMQVLAHAQVVLSTDSGPAHLGSALGVPVVSLFGATDPLKTAPQPKRGQILQAKDVPCVPCLKRTCSHHQPMACMNHVSVEQVVPALQHLMRT